MPNRIITHLNTIYDFITTNKLYIILGDASVFIGLILMGDWTDIAFLSFKTLALALIGGIFGVIGKYLGELIIKQFDKKFKPYKKDKQ